MKLPAHLDYDETSGPDQDGGTVWWPVVRCIIAGCRWTHDASWDDLGDDGEVDWLSLHPAHAVSAEVRR